MHKHQEEAADRFVRGHRMYGSPEHLRKSGWQGIRHIRVQKELPAQRTDL